MIRDFIYLDTERVRSFSAQLFGGLTSERTLSGEHSIGGEGKVSGKVPLIFDASGAVDYHYLKSQSETKSLHDQLFAEFFDRLMAEHKIGNLSEVDERDWSESLFRDGAFYFVRCPLKIVDYKTNVALFEALPEMQNMINKITGLQVPGAPASRQVKGASKTAGQSVQQVQQQQLQQMRPQLKAMAGLMTQFYGDLIRIKVFPFRSSPDRVLIGSADRVSFRYPPGSLTNLYGATIDADWTCVVQVNKGISHAAGTLVSSSGNQLEDTFELLVDQFATLSSITQGITFPAVAVTPVAIYRDIR